MSTVHFTLATDIQNTTFYITYGDTNCLESKSVPESITASDPGSGKAQARNTGNCAYKNSKIHLYFWADPDHSEQLVKMKFVDPAGSDYWTPAIQYVADSYGLQVVQNDVNQFTRTLSSD